MKKEEVREMFNDIAPKYDFLNHLLSFNVDKIWRRKTINCLKEINPKQILDIACGTGDLTFEALKLNPEHIHGIDLSEKMISLAKIKQTKKKNGNKITFQQGDSENIEFSENTFDAVTVAFGVRNFENLEKGLSEIYRVLTLKGKVAILEFSLPGNKFWNKIYNLYFNVLLPLVGKLVSGNFSAYRYLPNSVKDFIYGENFLEKMEDCGFTNVKQKKLTGGIATIYQGYK